jgi:biotin carboxyl carrier protein
VAESRALGNGWWLVTDNDKRWRVAIVDGEDGTWFFVDGQVGRIDVESEPATRGRAKGRGDTGVMAPMPATVVAINTAAGQSVKEGETVIVLEAMKMELPIKSPRSGIVKAVHCAKGDLVQPGVNLLEIE